MIRKVWKVKRARSLVPRKAVVPKQVAACPAFPPGSSVRLQGGGVKCADARNWLSCWERVPRILVGVTLLALAATAQCPRGTALLWDSTFHSLS